MRVLTVGSGVIGTVYGAHLAAGGHAVSVLRHSPRTDHVAAGGMEARDVLGGRELSDSPRLASCASCWGL